MANNKENKSKVDGIERLDQILARFEGSSLVELSYEDGEVDITLRRPEEDDADDFDVDTPLILAPVSGQFELSEALEDGQCTVKAGASLGAILTPHGGVELRALSDGELGSLVEGGSRVEAGQPIFEFYPA